MTDIKQFNQNDYKITKREVVYQGIFRLARYHLSHRLFEGGFSEIMQREVLERSSAAAVLPYDPVLDRVILIEQFRPGSLSDPESPWLIEIPAGILGKNEKPLEVAYRESIEEAGCELKNLQLVCEYYPSPGGSNEYLNVYCGQVDAKEVGGVHGLKHEHEDIRVLNLSVDEALLLLQTGKIKTSPAIITLLWLQLHRVELQKSWLSLPF